MADDASVSFQATILPDEIAKTLTGTMTVTPDDANDKWYYKLTSVTTTSADLIAGRFLDYTAVDLSLIHISEPRDVEESRMPSSA